MTGQRAVVIEPNQIAIEAYEPPVLKANEVLIKTSVSLISPGVISWDPATRTIHIDKAFDEAIPAPTQVRFRIDSGISNSFSTDPITPIVVQTLDPDGEIIDEGSSGSIEFTANEISAIEATACADLLTVSTTEEICTYRLKFLIGAEYPILSGSVI